MFNFFKSKKCEGKVKYGSAYSAAVEAANSIGRWSFFQCRKCKGWHIKNDKK